MGQTFNYRENITRLTNYASYSTFHCKYIYIYIYNLSQQILEYIKSLGYIAHQ